MLKDYLEQERRKIRNDIAGVTDLAEIQLTKRKGTEEDIKKLNNIDPTIDIKKMIRNSKILQKISFCNIFQI